VLSIACRHSGLGREAPSLAVRRGLGRSDVAGLDQVRVPSRGAVYVFLHAREMTDQALNVQPRSASLRQSAACRMPSIP
jgi:hypothetical protein